MDSALRKRLEVARDSWNEIAGDEGVTSEGIAAGALGQAFDCLILALAGCPVGFDLYAYLHRQRDWSRATFGPGERTEGLVDHIRKELDEVLESGGALEEWVDVVILALDGAWRAGHWPLAICEALEAKAAKNRARRWPDWRTAEPGKAIEHIRDEEPTL